MFRLWSENSSEAKNLLSPDLGLRIWDSLSEQEKYRIWKYLEIYFFDANPKWSHNTYGGTEKYFEFFAPNEHDKTQRIEIAINGMYHSYKAKNYTPKYLETGDNFAACTDFYSIFTTEEGHVVLELLSFYCLAMIRERKGKFYSTHGLEEDKNEYKEEALSWEMEGFNDFRNLLNDVFTSFGLNVHLTENGFVPRQEEKITKDIYEPVIKCLANPKWVEVNKLLADAFLKYRENNPSGFSTCVTHTVSAIQAFLQITVTGKTGTGEISKLIVQAQKEKLIPSDMFTKEIFKNIESIIMRERQETGDPHPKKEYATEKNAKLVLNLAMVFFQHCLVGN